MDLSMGPPALPGFSLRVKLYSASAAKQNDNPLRCFRVVASGNMTIQHFCQEASRVHQINYGEPLQIKKCTDDELFDITQGDSISALFSNMATIRLVQAPSQPSIRDSVPPSSGLRYHPPEFVGLKRHNEHNIGSFQSHKFVPNKRQRIAGGGPDDPLPSRESEPQTADTRLKTRSRSWQKLGSRRESSVSQRMTPIITETPPPEQHQALRSPILEGRPRDLQPTTTRTFVPESSPPVNQGNPNHPVSARSNNSHIERDSEQQTSASTPATSPPSSNHSTANIQSPNRRRRNDVSTGSNMQSTRAHSRSEHSETSAESSRLHMHHPESNKSFNDLFSRTKGLNGGKAKTPPSTGRRSRELSSKSGSLPLTPRSKIQETAKLHASDSAAQIGSPSAGLQVRGKSPRSARRPAVQIQGQIRRAKPEHHNDHIQQKSQAAMMAKATRLEKEREHDRHLSDDTEVSQPDLRKHNDVRKLGKLSQMQSARDSDGNAPVGALHSQAEIESQNRRATPSKAKVSTADETSHVSSTRPPSSTSLFPGRKRSAMKGSRAATSPNSVPEPTPHKVGIDAQIPMPKQKSAPEDSRQDAATLRPFRRLDTASMGTPTPRPGSAKQSDQTAQSPAAARFGPLENRRAVKGSNPSNNSASPSSSNRNKKISLDSSKSIDKPPSQELPTKTNGEVNPSSLPPASRIHRDIMPPATILRRLDRFNSTSMGSGPTAQALTKDVAAAGQNPKPISASGKSAGKVPKNNLRADVIGGDPETTKLSGDSSISHENDRSNIITTHGNGQYIDGVTEPNNQKANTKIYGSTPLQHLATDEDNHSESNDESAQEERARTPVVHVQHRPEGSASLESSISSSEEEIAFKGYTPAKPEEDDSDSSEDDSEDSDEADDRQIAQQLRSSGQSEGSTISDSQKQTKIPNARPKHNSPKPDPQQIQTAKPIHSASPQRSMHLTTSQPTPDASVSTHLPTSRGPRTASKVPTQLTGPQFGASLSSLNRNKTKPALNIAQTSSQRFKPDFHSVLSASRTLAKLQQLGSSDEASESDSENDSDEGDFVVPRRELPAPQVRDAKHQQNANKRSFEDSEGDDTDGNSDDMEVDRMVLQAQADLEKQVAQMTGSSPGKSEGKPSSQKVRHR